MSIAWEWGNSYILVNVLRYVYQLEVGFANICWMSMCCKPMVVISFLLCHFVLPGNVLTRGESVRDNERVGCELCACHIWGTHRICLWWWVAMVVCLIAMFPIHDLLRILFFPFSPLPYQLFFFPSPFLLLIDINKFLWMVRIGGSTEKGQHIKEADYFTPQGEFRVDREGSPILLNCLMYKMCYYRFGQVYTEQG